MLTKTTPKATGAEKATAHIERALKPSQQGMATSDPATKLLATLSGIPSLRRMPQPPSGVLAIPLPTAKKSNQTKFKG